MRRIYANLLGDWIDITDCATVADNQNPSEYFEEMLAYESNSDTASCFKFDYIHVQYKGKDYRIHPSCIQFVE